MLESGSAYRCFCTPEELDERRKAAEARKEAFKYDRRCDRLTSEEIERRVASGEQFTIRFRIPEGTTEWIDLVHEKIAFPNKDLEDFVILRSNATPIYNLAVVSDDIAMGITIVMRGDDHISNTPKQILLYKALGAEIPVFAHLPMIHGMDGKKLSKRHGATAVGDYQHQGILADAMLNFLALLGWSPGGDREIMTKEEMIELFNPDGLQKKAAIFDPQKLEWMNGQHLSKKSADELGQIITAANPGVVLPPHVIDLLKIRARRIDDIVRQAGPYVSDAPMEYEAEAVGKNWSDKPKAREILAATADTLSAISGDDWKADHLEPALRKLAENLGVGAGKVFSPMRVALTGFSVSPGIFEILEAQGRDRALNHIRNAVAWLDSNP
jgi:glutamyl-tRNA synthetase